MAIDTTIEFNNGITYTHNGDALVIDEGVSPSFDEEGGITFSAEEDGGYIGFNYPDSVEEVKFSTWGTSELHRNCIVGIQGCILPEHGQMVLGNSVSGSNFSGHSYDYMIITRTELKISIRNTNGAPYVFPLPTPLEYDKYFNFYLKTNVDETAGWDGWECVINGESLDLSVNDKTDGDKKEDLYLEVRFFRLLGIPMSASGNVSGDYPVSASIKWFRIC